ncbi:MAG TPA: protein kinase [Pyrinomonadaceae bacterium]
MTTGLSPDTKLSHYRIVSKIGEGGMGEVYLAEDTRLRRRVALKVLAESVSADADRLLRFEREAFAASALNHPNILTIFEFGEENNRHFLVSEFVDGESLRERMSRSTITLTETLEIVIQIASALQAAHGAGIIHRDIKPDNVMIRADGYVKVLDFGLAKLSEPGAVATGLVSDPEAQTRMQLQTQAGIIMGTVAYMSPEQARGLEVDKRTDIWSLGCVLYEMLSRQQPFGGETITDTLANIIHREPVSIVSVRHDANAELERIVNKMLSKNRDHRYANANVLLADLKQLQKRLEFEEELERSSPPNSKTEARTQLIRSATTDQSATCNSIAVLPFSNLSAVPDNDYFCDGLAEELLNSLAKIEHLKVAARTSAFSFKGKRTKVSEIGKQLGVKTVLEGSVRRSGNRLRITVQLVNASDGYQLWTERYDREMQDIFDVQDEITLAIVDALRLNLFSDEKAALLKRYTDNTEAYQLYLQGRYCYNKYTPEYLQKGIEYFEKAIELEPNYAPAYAGLGFCYGALFYFGSLGPEEIVPKYRALTNKALEIDDQLADAYLSRASIEFYYDWDFARAELDYQRAIELNPNSPDAHWRYGHFLACCERFDEAIKEGKRAIELDPLSLVVQFFMTRILLLAQRVDEGSEQLRKMQELEPNFAGGLTQLGALYLVTGKYDDAIEAYKKALTLGHFVIAALSCLGAAYGVAGKRDDAYKILDQLLETKQSQYVSPFSIARIYSGLGENDKAFEWFEKAFEERSGELVALKSETLAHLLGDTISRDDRFQDLVRRVGMPMDRPALNKATREASEAHTVVFDSAERHSGKLVKPETSEPKQSTDSSSLADAESREPEPARPNISARVPDTSRPATRKSVLVIGLVVSLLAVATGGYWFFGNRGAGQINSIAVMPFVNASGNADVEYLSDGMTETLISSLSQVPNLSVKSRSTVFHYKGKETSAKKIGEELNVQAVLLGRVVERGEELNLNLELVNTQTQNVIWTGQYNRKHADLVTLQSEIARDVSQKLERKLSGVAEDKLAKKYSANPDAYELYLRGRYHWNRRTVEDDLKGLDYFEKAVKTDPKFALAYVGISDAHIMLGIPDAMAGAMSPAATLPPARAAAEKAIEVDPDLAEAYASRGHVKWKERDWSGAESDFKRSIQLNPNYSYAHLFYSIFLTFNGRFEEGLIESKRSVELDPYSIPIVANVAYVNYFARRTDEAIASGRRAVAFDPSIPIARQRLGMAYEQKGMLPEAIAEFQAAVIQSNRVQLSLTSLAHAYALSGNKVEARKILAELEERSKQQFVSSYLLATVHVALGEKRLALELLEHAYKQNSIDMVQAKTDPKLDPLRDEPRFQELLKKIGFPE